MKVLRFTAWQKIWGDENNAQMKLPLRNWTTRTTPFSQGARRADGVAIEDMVNLVNTVSNE
jgi:hypothetical protein